MSNNAPDDIPVPTEEAWFTHSDGAKVYTKTWKTTGAPKARIVYLHGFSDHCNTCNPFFPILASRGVEVFGLDQRGPRCPRFHLESLIDRELSHTHPVLLANVV